MSLLIGNWADPAGGARRKRLLFGLSAIVLEPDSKSAGSRCPSSTALPEPAAFSRQCGETFKPSGAGKGPNLTLAVQLPQNLTATLVLPPHATGIRHNAREVTEARLRVTGGKHLVEATLPKSSSKAPQSDGSENPATSRLFDVRSAGAFEPRKAASGEFKALTLRPRSLY
jgi:hypothetical protein